MRRVLSPGWLGRHALTVALVVTFALLGRWQLARARESGGTIQNWGYAVEWWVFAAFVVFGWWRLVRADADPAPARPAHPAEPGGGDDASLPRVVQRTAEQQLAEEGGDAELDAYNRRLAWLATQPRDRA